MSNADAHLCQLISERKQPYALIRHYIGRLGSWRRAATFIAQKARTFSSRLEGATVSCVPYSSSAPRQDNITIGASTLEDLLARVLPSLAQSPHLRGSAMQHLQGIEYQKYRQERLRPQIHAEIAIAQHFSRQNLQFIAGDRYIGCSKKSCYACSLYLRYDDNRFAERPTHGNVYRAWTIPRDEHSRLSDKDVAILRRMTDRIQRDIQAQLLQPNLGQKQRFDSTTGMTWQAEANEA